MTALWCWLRGHRFTPFRYGIVTAYVCQRCGMPCRSLAPSKQQRRRLGTAGGMNLLRAILVRSTGMRNPQEWR